MLRERPPVLPWLCAILAAIAGWQALYCVAATQGKMSGLFFIGERMRWPAEIERGAFVYPNTEGYDGQIYRAIAHDPGFRGPGRTLNGARYWGRRILLPASAALLGGGNPGAIDFWYVAITDLLLALGGVCFVRLAADVCPPLLAAAVYCAVPAVVASTDRMVVDGPMVALSIVAWWCYRERRFVPMLVALAAAVLARETGLFVVAGIGLAYLLQRDFRRAGAVAASAIPAVAWWIWLALRTAPTAMDRQLSIPLLPQIARLFQSNPRPGAAPWLNGLLLSLDVVGCLCLLFAFGWVAATLVRERRVSEETAVILPMAFAALFFSSPTLLAEPYHFLRHASVLIVWVALRMMRVRPVYGAAYLLVAGLPILAYRGALLLR
jgi:hypothetical protein